MSNQEIAAAIRTIYNHWWQKWKDAKTPAEADQMTEEGVEIIRQYDCEKLVVNMVNDMVNEVSKRVDKPDRTSEERCGGRGKEAK